MKMTTREGFKVGQRVKLVDLSGGSYVTEGLLEGDIGIIERIFSPSCRGQLMEVSFPCIGEERLLFSHRFVPLIEPKPKFKIGDRVKVIKDLGWFNKTVGLNATVVDIIVHCGIKLYGLEVDDYVKGHSCQGKAKYGYGLFALEEDLEVFYNEPKFKVGDKVRVTKQMFSKDKPVGFVGKIGIVDCDEYYFENDDLYYEESQLELVINEIEEPAVEAFDRGRKELLEIQVDMVIYTGNKTILYYTAPFSGRKGRVEAKCHPDDEFSKDIGFKVAVLKAFQESIPHTIKGLTGKNA